MANRREYRGIYVALIHGADFQRLSANARACFYPLKLALGAAGIDALPGAAHQVASWTGLAPRVCERALTQLESENWIERDGTIIWLVRGLEFEPSLSANDPKHRASIANHLRDLPRLSIVDRFRERYAKWLTETPPPAPSASEAPSKGLPMGLVSTEKGEGRTNTETKTNYPHSPPRAMAEADRVASDTASPEPPPAETALLARFTESSDRAAVAAFLDGVPADQLREGWVGILGACLEGLGLEGGSAASPSAVAWACREHRTKRRDYDSRLFRRFVESAARTLSRSPPARRASDTASSTATPNGTPPRATPALKIRRVNTA